MDGRVRVCMVTGFRPTLGGGGTEKHVAELVRGLDARGFEVTVICEDRRFLPDPDGTAAGTILGIPSENIRATGWVPRYREKSRHFARALDPTQYEVVHCHNHWGYHSALKLAKLRSRPAIISTFHLTPLGSLERFREVGWAEPKGAPIDRAVAIMEETAAHLSDRCIAVSRGVCRELVDLYSVPERQTRTIYNWYDPAVFASQNQSAARLRLGLLPDDPWLLYVGHFGLERGRLLAEVMRRLPKDVRLLVIHPEPDKEIEEEFGSRVAFAGYVEPHKMAPYYSAADLQCFPTVYGAFGLVLVEGMACGCPAVVFDYSAMNEIVREECGYLVRDATAEAYASAILDALQDAPAKREAAVRRARDFEMDHQIDKVANLYRENMLLSNRTDIRDLEQGLRRERRPAAAVSVAAD